MKFKLSKNVIRLVILGLVLFMVGFFAAKLVTPTRGEKATDGSSGSGGFKPTIEKKETSYTIIIVIVALVAAVVGYGYFRERKRRKNI
jgi:hypothetical protein